MGSGCHVIPQTRREFGLYLYIYRTLVETMNEGTATIDFDGTILYCTSRFTEFRRMPPQAIIGTSICLFISPENEITFKVLLENGIDKGEIKLLAEGEISLPVYLFISSLKTRESPNAWCLVVTYLAEQKKNEEEIQSLANIVKSSNDAIITQSFDGIIISWNKRAEQVFGYSAK